MSAPIVPKSMYGVLTELIAAQSALNMEPTLIEGAEGPYSSDKDYWVNHSYAHISAAIEGVDGLLELEASHERLRVALLEGIRAIGDHNAPNDCYATGPVTGNPFRDLIQCPACSFLHEAEDALAAIPEVKS